MADFAHSLPRRATSSNKMSNANGLTAKNVYEDVFGGGSKFGIPTFSSVDDYSEVFSSYTSSRGCSIPFLDLPVVDEADVMCSNLDYSEIFGGFDCVDYAVPYEELFLEAKAGESSSEDVWTPAETGSPSEESSEDPVCSESNQAFSNVESDFAYDNVKQFNMSYHMSNQMSKEDGISGTTHIAELNAVPAYTFVVDENLPLQTATCDNPPTEEFNDHSQNTDIADWKMDGEEFWEVAPVQSASQNDQKPQKIPDSNEAYNEKKPFLTVTEINLRTQPCEVPPPARPPPKFTIKQGTHSLGPPGRTYSVNYSRQGAASASSPPFLDVEVDASSSAAASAAAMKEAMEEAEARLKTAKELMKRKKDSLQHRKRMGMKEDPKGNETRLGGIAHDSGRVKEEMFHTELERKDSRLKEFDKEVKQKGVEVAQVAPQLEVQPMLFSVSKEPVDHKHPKERKLTKESQREEVVGEWKAEEQFFELVKKDTCGTTVVFPQQKRSEHNFTPTTRVYEQGQIEKKTEKIASTQQDKTDEKLQAGKGVCGLEEDKKRLEASQEVYDKAEHEDTIEAAQKTRKQEEHEKKLKEIHGQEKKEAFERAENEKKLKQAHEREEHENKLQESREREENEKKKKDTLQREENERKQREARQREENEKNQKEACEKEENERRQKEAREKEENERRMNERKQKEAREREENERKQKEARVKEENERRINEKKQEAREREENERRQKEAHEKEENEKRINEKKLEEARLREENERRQKEAREKEENEKKIYQLKQKAAWEMEENERRQKEAREKEENEKRLKEFHEMQATERKLKLDAEESERRLKEVREREENGRTHKEQSKRDENEERFKESYEWEENERKLRQAAEENEKKLKELCEEVTQKVLQKVTVESVETEEKLRELEEHHESEMRSEESCKREENDEHELSQDFHICYVEDKKHRAETVNEEITKPEVFPKAGVDTQEEIENSKASCGGCEQEKNNKKLKMAQKSRENEEYGELPNTAQSAFENRDNVKSFKEEEVSCEKDEHERSRTGHMTQSTSGHVDYEDNQIAAPKGKIDNSVKKSGNIENVVRQVKDEKYKREDLLHCEDQNKNIKASKRMGQHVEDAMKVEVVQPINEEERRAKPKVAEEFNANQERKDTYLNGSSARDGSGKEGRIVKEKELEKERLRKLEEDRQREREKDRVAVERVTREARERAYTDARERAERVAVERATAEARQRAMAEARERLEKACAEAREKSLAEKAYTEARLRAERAAVERATAEARERAVEKAMAERAAMEARERVERSFSEKFSATSRDSGLRHTASFSDLRDAQFQSTSSFSSSQRYPNSSNHGAFTTEKSQGTEVESAQRCKAKLERHQRTVERAAKALAEKNLRDHLAQREQAERNRLAESLDADVKRWSNGKEGNLRALLSTLQYILGSDSGWQPVPLTEVITAAAAKKAYRKATLCVHPDKLQQRGASIQQKYICEKVFDLLKDAWNKFNSEER